MKIHQVLVVAAVLLVASKGTAQTSLDSYIELIRSDLQTQKKALITEAMGFTDEEAKAFWPMYREYELEGAKLGDRRLANIKDFAEHYEELTDKKAEEIVKTSFGIQKDRVSLREKYYKKALKLIGVKRAARWAQIEGQIQSLLDAKIASEIPLLK